MKQLELEKYSLQGDVLCAANEVDMTERLESWRQSLEEREGNECHAVDKKHCGCTKVRHF